MPQILHTYTRADLLAVKNYCNKTRIDLSVLKTLRDLDICSKQKTHRGQRKLKCLLEDKQGLSNVCFRNAQTIKNKAELLKNHVIKNKLDILFLTETWLYTDDADNHCIIGDITPTGYTFRHWPRPLGGQYGGCGILYNDHFNTSL